MSKIDYLEQETKVVFSDYRIQLKKTIQEVCKKTGMVDNIHWYIFDEKKTDPITGGGFEGIDKAIMDLTHGLVQLRKGDVTYNYQERKVRISQSVIQKSIVPETVEKLEKAGGRDIPSTKDRNELAEIVISMLTIFENAQGSQDERLQKHYKEYFSKTHVKDKFLDITDHLTENGKYNINLEMREDGEVDIVRKE